VPTAGNYGLMDQMEALRFVKKNIRAFGGDDENVTVFGESAGAISICALLGSPDADPLFEKAIIESGMCAISTYDEGGLIGMPSSRELAELVVEDVGCANAAFVADCLRSLPASELVGAASLLSVVTGDLQSVSALSPLVDGVLVPEQPISRIRRGDVAKPIIVGSTRDEGVLFTSADIVLTRIALRNEIEALIGESPLVDEVLAIYPFEDFPIAKDAWTALMGEATFICSGVEIAKAMAPFATVFAYHFTRLPPALLAVGVTHGIELPYVFGTFGALALIPLASDHAVSAYLQTAWGQFAWTGAPGFEQGFTPYTVDAPSFALIDDPVTMVSEIRDGRCAALHALGLVY
jgi:para-nitrobenzyl esterase